MKVNHPFNDMIISLWNSYYKEEKINEAPALYNNFKRNSILFIGLNPSFSENGIGQICDKNKLLPEKVIQALQWESFNDNNYNLILKFEDAAQKNYSYFKTLKEDIADKLNMKPNFIDIFFVRKTKQKEITSFLFKTGKCKYQLKDFYKEQLKISIEMIKDINPKLIFVNSSLASKILLCNMKFSEYRKFMCHSLRLNNKLIPVILSHSISGQRRLDEYSRNRLVWYLKRII